MMLNYKDMSSNEFKRLCRVLFYNRTSFNFKILTDHRYRTGVVIDKRCASKIFVNPDKYKEALITKGYIFKSYNGKSSRGHIKILLPQTIISYLIAKNDVLPHINMSKRDIIQARNGLDKEFREFNWDKFKLIVGYDNPAIKKFVIEKMPYYVEDLQNVGFKLFDSEELKKGEFIV